MKPAVRWSISAALFVLMFVGARIYVGQQLSAEREERAASPRLPVPPGAPGAGAESAGDLAFDLREAVRRGLAEGADRAALHREIDALGTLEVEPEDLDRVVAAVSELEASAEAAKAPDVHAHLVSLRAELLERAGRSDAALAERLATWQASDPAAFAWRSAAPVGVGAASDEAGVPL